MFPWWEVILRLMMAAFLGGVIGWERETAGKPAGFRTTILVSLSVTMFVVGATQTAAKLGEPVDTVRAMAGIAQGVGFLGAGAILQSHREVRWLTTAASLWAAAALGLCVGLGSYLVAIAGSVLVYGTLKWLVIIEARWATKLADAEKGKQAPTDRSELIA